MGWKISSSVAEILEKAQDNQGIESKYHATYSGVMQKRKVKAGSGDETPYTGLGGGDSKCIIESID